MILELADIRIHPGQNAAFEAAIAKGVNEVLAHAKGCQGFKVNKGIESPERYVLQIFWDTLEDTLWAFASPKHSPNGAALWDRFLPAHRWWSTLTWSPNPPEDPHVLRLPPSCSRVGARGGPR